MDDLSEKNSDSNQTAKLIQMAVCKSLKEISGRNFSVIKTDGTGMEQAMTVTFMIGMLCGELQIF